MRGVGQVQEEIKLGRARIQQVIDAMAAYADKIIDEQLTFYLERNTSPFQSIAERIAQEKRGGEIYKVETVSEKLNDPEVLAHAFHGLAFDLGKFLEYAKEQKLDIAVEDVRQAFAHPGAYQKFDNKQLIDGMKQAIVAKLQGFEKAADRYELLAWIEGRDSQLFVAFYSPAYAEAKKRGDI